MANKSTHNLPKDVTLSVLTTYQAGILQAHVNRILRKHCDIILQPYGITKMHWLIIGFVLDSGKAGVRLTDVSQGLGTTIAYITNAVKLLESKGILLSAQNAADSRSKLITVSSDFLPKCAEIEDTLRIALRKSIYSHVTPADLQTYMNVMQQLVAVDED